MVERLPVTAFPSPGHDHATCLAGLLERAGSVFEARGQRLTPLRRHVLEEIAGSHHAIGAYDVLDRLARKGTRLAPISVYRAIDALIAAGLVHRLESRSAFFACHVRHPADRRLLVLSCEGCNAIAEVPGDDVFADIEAAARRAGFTTRSPVVEVAGLCSACSRAPSRGVPHG